MCAINGFNWNDEELAKKMNVVPSHRGPDGTRVWSDGAITLGHNRLAIIDLDQRANQPMANASDNLVITYNGELYNYKELKSQLDYPWKTESDTEVILAAYEKWGAKMLEKFNGIFAFAIRDKNKLELFVARDRSGIKPLYYYLEGNKFIFSSEIKAILEHDIPRKLDHDAYAHYMTVLFTPGPFTLFKNIKKFPPSHFATLKDGKLNLTHYSHSNSHLGIGSPSGAKEGNLKSIIETAVQRQLVSDRPVGLYLSGGIDSSVVLACMRKVTADVDTFSVGFELADSEQSEKFNADFELARRSAEFFKTRHHEVLLPREGLIENLEKAIWHLDEPLGNATVIPQLVLAEFTKQFATVALTGDGGDELFGGYPRYQKSRWLDSTPFLSNPISRFAKFMFQSDSPVLPDKTREFFEQNFPRGSGNVTAQLMNIDRQTWLIDEALLRTDKMNMASGVEARVPFLDEEVITFAASIPVREKLSRGGKGILKDAFESELPSYLLAQPKRGFFAPAAKWLRRPEFIELAHELFRDKPEFIKLLDEHISKRAYHAPIIWAELAFQIWVKKFKVEI